MPRKLRQLRADLAREGWKVDHYTGSHQIWKHPLLPGDEVNLAGKDGADAHHYQEKDVREAVARVRAARGRSQ